MKIDISSEEHGEMLRAEKLDAQEDYAQSIAQSAPRSIQKILLEHYRKASDGYAQFIGSQTPKREPFDR